MSLEAAPEGGASGDWHILNKEGEGAFLLYDLKWADELRKELCGSAPAGDFALHNDKVPG